MVGYLAQVVIREDKDGGLLHKAWIGFKRANNPRNGEPLQDKLYWASMIQAIQTDLGIARSSFPQLSLLGDLVFLYDKDNGWNYRNNMMNYGIPIIKRRRENIFVKSLTPQ
jgi:hypothetical protein